MPRLIDDIRAGGSQMPLFIKPTLEKKWLEYATRVMPLLADLQIPVLLIDNVADYYATGTGQEYWSLDRDFPNLAPPFTHFWCEHRLPRRMHSDDRGDTDMSTILGKDARLGVLFLAATPDQIKGEGMPEDTRWVYWMDLFIHYDHDKGARPYGPHGSIFLAVDKDGRVLGRAWMQSYAGQESNEIMKAFITWLHPSLLAICFLHCKNVTITEETVPKPLARKHHARTGQWPTKYKTLVIEPLKQILRTQGGAGAGNGLATAMHICRGHFRDYRQGAGLFGKYHALVWTPMTVRGTKGKGGTPPREVRIKL